MTATMDLNFQSRNVNKLSKLEGKDNQNLIVMNK